MMCGASAMLCVEPPRPVRPIPIVDFHQFGTEHPDLGTLLKHMLMYRRLRIAGLALPLVIFALTLG